MKPGVVWGRNLTVMYEGFVQKVLSLTLKEEPLTEYFCYGNTLLLLKKKPNSDLCLNLYAGEVHTNVRCVR